MSNIVALLNTLQLPALERDFINTNIENAADVVSLDGTIYTDFVGRLRQWTLSYDSLTEDEYDAIRALYDAQFSTFEYPTLTIAYYGITELPVRMYINEKNIWNDCGDVRNVVFTLREQSPVGTVVPDHWIVDADGEGVFAYGNTYVDV